MAKKILTTHVGSLPRSQAVTELLFARERGEDYSSTEFEEVIAEHVNEMVSRQVQAGIDIVSDGEAAKISYATYVKDRYTGFSGDSARKPPKDLQLFPEFMERLAKQGGTPQYARPVCSGEIKAKNYDDLNADIRHLQTALKQHKAHQGFMNAASPGVISLFLPNEYYPSREAYLEVLGETMKQEYEAIVAAGLQVQLDCPDLALSRHMLFNDLSDAEFVKIARQHIQVLNHSLRDIDAEQIRVHICWGNYEGPHICDIAMDKMLSCLMETKARYVLFESSNPRHAHEWKVFQDRKDDIPDDKILVPGVIDSTTNFVEHPELVAERIGRFADIVGEERVIAGSDCGFGTFAGFGAVSPDIVWAKLEALAQGAALAMRAGGD